MNLIVVKKSGAFTVSVIYDFKSFDSRNQHRKPEKAEFGVSKVLKPQRRMRYIGE